MVFWGWGAPPVFCILLAALAGPPLFPPRPLRRGGGPAPAPPVSGLGEDVAELSQATAQALQGLGGDIEAVQDAVSQLRRDIENGTVAVKPVFPVVSADPASPKEGEAWIKT